MPLNKAKGRMFKSVGWTWNPIVGCTHECDYCWAESLRKRWGKPFAPALQESAFKDEFPNDGSIIFVGSMGDLFCDSMKNEWIKRVIDKASEATDNRFLFQTKNPERLLSFMHEFDKLKENVVLGTTIETNRDTPWSLAPPPVERFLWLWYTQDEHVYRNHDLFLSLEPLAEFDLQTLVSMIVNLNPIAVEIGLEHYGDCVPRPSEHSVKMLLLALRFHNIHYVLKENLRHLEEGKTDE